MASTDMEKGYQQGGPPLCLDPTSINLGPHSQAIHDTKEPPKPTNETLYERVKAAKTQSHGIVFLKEFFTILIGSMASMIIIGLFYGHPSGYDCNRLHPSKSLPCREPHSSISTCWW
ncbi:uncharacterized protein LOC124261665 isoform X2 [Haliotis rubra]|uniref:uncharacterized protein LOC124261665 isoform X2 n=1 Tax=Haliotis rubra TaxID=36100 RepID=UPI001EE5BC2D|nr:uncharacterized protein LOC124261665 isoform X2 [Haliotis rubra]